MVYNLLIVYLYIAIKAKEKMGLLTVKQQEAKDLIVRHWDSISKMDAIKFVKNNIFCDLKDILVAYNSIEWDY